MRQNSLHSWCDRVARVAGAGPKSFSESNHQTIRNPQSSTGTGSYADEASGSKKAGQFTESVIREMTRLAQRHQAVNLSQGFPDFPAPAAIKDAACRAILDDINHTLSPGARGRCARRCVLVLATLRRDGRRRRAGHRLLRSTEAMMATLLATVDPGDEVIVFEPFYENYGPDAIVSGAVPRYVTLREPDWAFDPAELARRSTSARAPSSSTRRTTPPARSSRARSSRRSPRSADSGTSSPSPTRSTSTSSTTATRTCRWPRSTGWPIGRSPSTACRRRTV